MIAKKTSSTAPSACVNTRIAATATSATPAATQSVRCEMETDRRRERLLSDGDATATGVEADVSDERSLRMVNRPFGACTDAEVQDRASESCTRRETDGRQGRRGRLRSRR